MTKKRLDKKITSGPIGSGKLLIMVYKYNYPDVLRKAIDEHIRKFQTNKLIKDYSQDVDHSYCRISVRELNRLINKHVDNKFDAGSLLIRDWSDVTRHLIPYVQYGASIEYSTIDELVGNFFKYMPFFDYSPDRVKEIYNDLGFGYCCDDCCGEYEEYKESHKVHNLHRYVDYLNNLNINVIHK